MYLRGSYNFKKSQFEAFPRRKASAGLGVSLNATYFPCAQEHGPLVEQLGSCKYSTYSSVICSKNKENKKLPLSTELYKPSLKKQYHHLLHVSSKMFSNWIMASQCILQMSATIEIKPKFLLEKIRKHYKHYTGISMTVVSHKKKKKSELFHLKI